MNKNNERDPQPDNLMVTNVDPSLSEVSQPESILPIERIGQKVKGFFTERWGTVQLIYASILEGPHESE